MIQEVLMKEGEFSYENWLKAVPDSLTGDPLWRMNVYRLALFVAELGWHDVQMLLKIIPSERTRMIREEEARYIAVTLHGELDEDIEGLLKVVPLPVP